MSNANDLQTQKSNELYTLLAVVRTIVGKNVRVIKKDRLDDACNIADKLRWKIGDEFKVVKIECLPWGIFLYDDNGNNLNYRRAELIG